MNFFLSLSNLLFPYANCEESTSQLCKFLKVKSTRSNLQRILKEHPDYPSFLSISDILKEYNIESMAIKTDFENFKAFPLPLISQVVIESDDLRDDYFAVVTAFSDSEITFYHPLEKKMITMKNSDFKRLFRGYVLLAEANEHSIEKDYKKNLCEERSVLFTKVFALAGLPILALILCGLSLFDNTKAAIFPVLFALLCLGGTIVGALLLWYEIDQFNPVLQQICSVGKKINCSAILHSPAAKIFGISWSIIGFSYFSGSLLALLFTGLTNPPTLLLLAWLNVTALPYTFFSIYYQSKIAKQWCVMCLAVQALLVLLFVNAFAGGLHFVESFSNITAYHIVSILVSFAIPFLVATLLIPALQNAKEGKRNRNELQKIKHNEQIFEALLAKQKVITEPLDGLGIQLGRPEAKYKLVKVCNPYCEPCAKAHPTIESLLNNNPDVQLQIIFTATDDENDYRFLPVSHLLAIAEDNNEQVTKKALDDWYIQDTKDYNVFSEKYPVTTELKRQSEKLRAMSVWCKKTEIEYTPTFFLNGCQLPEQYSVADLKYFFSV